MGQHWSHLTPTKRIQLDAFIRAGMKPTDIAKELGVHHTTIYRELKRCTYEHLNSDYTTETRYNPDGAQARYEANLRAKGPELKIGNDYELADYLIAKIRDEKYSPEAAIGEAEVKGWPFKTHICASTAYNYIRSEIFGDELTVSMLPQHGKRHQPERPAGSMPRKPAGRSIEERPEHINNRSTFGHWEMDSVESCQGVSNTYIVMTERKTRWELIIPSPDKTAASVVAAIDGLEAKYGDLFPKVFRSITCDNGCEFADAAGIERSASGKGTRALVLDIDNTLTADRSQELPDEVAGWLAQMKEAGVGLTIASNGAEKRVRPFAEKLSLAYLYRSAKPLPFALMVARRRMGVKRKQMAMVGDQLYADRMAAALYGIPGLMVIPRGPDLGAQVVLKRKWEKRHWQEYYDRGGKTL